MAFEQAQIPVRKVQQFEKLQAVVERAFAAENIGRLLSKMQRSGARIREFEKVLEKGVFDGVIIRSGERAQLLYAALPLSDQALMREFYLERIENVDPRVRQRFQKLYQYY